MPLKLLSPGGGSVLLQANTTSLDYTLTVPAVTANVVTTGDSNTITSGMLSANSVTSTQLSSSSITAAKLSSGMIVKSTSYCSGYGSGARTQSSAQAWYTITIAGTSKDSNYPASNANIRYFDKVRTDTHLRIRSYFPIYITPGGTGVGFRVRMVLSNVSATFNDDNNYFTVGILSTGQAERWGALGYGGDNVGIVTTYYDTQYSDNSSSVLSYSGRLHYYFQGWTWASSDTAFWIDFDNTYPKYATWTVEEYIP